VLMGKGLSASTVASHQRKYKKEYSALLKQSNIDLGRYAGQLKSIIPGMSFQVKNNAIVGKKVVKSVKKPASKPQSRTQSGPKKITQFQDVKDLGCGGMASGNIDFSRSKIINTVIAAVGTCANKGKKRALLTGLEVSPSSSVTMKADLSVSAAAGALLGASVGLAEASLGESRVSALCFAPIAWICSAHESITNAFVNLNGSELLGNDSVAAGQTYTSVMGVAAIGSGISSVNKLEVLFQE